MTAAGKEAASHSAHKRRMNELIHESLSERVESQPIAFFCYPAGRYNDTAIAAVRKAGYLAATTTNYGPASPKQGYFTLDRVRINGSDGLSGFAAKLRAL